jgi:hypothetical protein
LDFASLSANAASSYAKVAAAGGVVYDFTLPMRLLLTALLGSHLLAAQAAPSAYHPPRHFYTPRHQPYRRLPVRLTFGAHTAYYDGDLTNQFSGPGFSLGLTHTLSPHFTLGADLTYLRLEANDYFPDRGLHFTTNDGVLTSFVRYNLFADKSMYIGPNYRPTKAQIFLQGGVGLLLNNPKTTILSTLPPYGRIALAPEVQGGYPTLAGVLPLGGGATLKASRSLYLTLEGLYYFTTTDLLDGVSRPVDPRMLDKFATLSLKAEFAFNKRRGKPLVHFD